MTKRNEALAFQTEQWQDVGEVDVVQPPASLAAEKPLGRSENGPEALCWAPAGHTQKQAQQKPLSPRTPTEILTVQRVAAVERLSIYSRTVPSDRRDDYKPILTVTERQAESLRAHGLIEYKGRRIVTHALIANGATVHDLHAVLRQHIRETLPMAEDNQTVRKVRVGGGIYHEPIHEQAWDDGRPLPGTLGENERDEEAEA